MARKVFGQRPEEFWDQVRLTRSQRWELTCVAERTGKSAPEICLLKGLVFLLIFLVI